MDALRLPLIPLRAARLLVRGVLALLDRWSYKFRVYPWNCGTCRRDYNALSGCGGHLECRLCGDLSCHMYSRRDRAEWRHGHGADCQGRRDNDRTYS